MNESDIKIKMLKEDNDDLTRELRVKSRSLWDALEQVDRLLREKTEWQELYLSGAPVKRAAEGNRTLLKGQEIQDGRAPQSGKAILIWGKGDQQSLRRLSLGREAGAP